jgi:hypothetical protein
MTQDEARELVEGEHFKGGEVVIDGKDFRDCVFENCVLVYNGGPAARWINCEKRGGGGFRFDAYALNVTNAMMYIYHQYPGGNAVMERMFATIRKGPENQDSNGQNEGIG